MSVAKKPDKGDALMRTLAAKASNKYCFDCLKPGTQRAACLTLGTFICDQCAGRQRGLPGFVVGTISARTFTEKEAAVFERNGNKRLRKVWYNALDDEKLKALIATLGDDGKRWLTHLQDVYITKRYYKAPTDAAAGPAAAAPASNPGTRSRGQSGAAPLAAAAPATERRPSAAAPAASAVPLNAAAPASAPSGKASAAAAAPSASAKPATVQELSLLDDSVLAAVNGGGEAVGKAEKKAQSKALPADPEPDDGFDPFAATPVHGASSHTQSAAPAAAQPNGHHSPASPAAVAPGGPGASPIIPTASTVKALRDCLSTIQSKASLSHAQLRTLTLQALDEMQKAAAPSPVVLPSTATLQPGMPSPAIAMPFGGVATPFMGAGNGNASATSTLQPGMPAPAAAPAAAAPTVNRLPSLGSLIGAGAWATETPAAAVPAAASRPAAPAPAPAAATNPFAFDDEPAHTGGDNPFAFGGGSAAAAPAAAAKSDNPFGDDFAADAAPAAAVRAVPASVPPRSNTGPTISAAAFPPHTPLPPVGAANVLSPFGMVSPPTATPASAMSSPFGAGVGITPTPVTSPFGVGVAAAPARPPLAPQFLAMLSSNPTFLQQFVAQFGYDPVAEANAAAAASAFPPASAPAPPSAFIASGPLAGIQPLAVKSTKPAEPAAPPKPDLFADFNPLK